MRVMKRMLGVLLSLVLACSVAVPAKAAPYTYTVRIFAGQQGMVDGKEVLVYNNLEYGSRLSFNLSLVTLKDGSKYYVKGIRESGKDNSTATTTSFVVTGDRDYVVAYGLLNHAVAYTINYQDAQGNELAPSETYYGNVGDKPVIAYLYVDGYQPQAYNLTKTLSENAAENVFTFVYTEIPPGEVITVVIPGRVIPGAVLPPVYIYPEGTQGTGTEDAAADGGGMGTAVNDGGAGEDGQDAADNAGEDEQDAAETPDTPDDGNGQEEIPDEDTPQGEEPQEIVDMDDPETPLGEFDQEDGTIGIFNGNASFIHIPYWVLTLIIIGVLAAAGAGIWFLTRLQRKKNEKKRDRS